jgi:hypothetical protein
MNGQNKKDLLKKLVSLAGVASASALLSLPALAQVTSTPGSFNADSHPETRLFLDQTGAGAGATATGGSMMPLSSLSFLEQFCG